MSGAFSADGYDFGSVLKVAIEAYGPLCVGVDPHAFLLEEWGLPDTADGARDFGLRVVDAAAGRVGVIKPQVAFFERFGSAGFAALEQVLQAARAKGLITIADAKRGDVGSTVDAYAAAWLTPGAPLEADALTVSAFQGVGSIAGAMQYAVDNSKGLFVLAATSNPESLELQRARLERGGEPLTVSRAIIDDVSAFNAAVEFGGPLGSIGVVLGATLDLAAAGLDISAGHAPALPVLAPGFGHQGARVEDLRSLFGSLAPATLVNESRSVLAAGPRGIADAIDRRAAEVRAALV